MDLLFSTLYIRIVYIHFICFLYRYTYIPYTYTTLLLCMSSHQFVFALNSAVRRSISFFKEIYIYTKLRTYNNHLFTPPPPRPIYRLEIIDK